LILEVRSFEMLSSLKAKKQQKRKNEDDSSAKSSLVYILVELDVFFTSNQVDHDLKNAP